MTIDYDARAYHYGDAQDAVKSSYKTCSGSGPQMAIAESKHPPKKYQMYDSIVMCEHGLINH